MSCNSDGRNCKTTGAQVGQPDTETLQMQGRKTGHCPDCGAFVAENGLCARCPQLSPATAETEAGSLLKMAVVTVPTPDKDRVIAMDGSFWRDEFGAASGQPLPLRNGDVAVVGKRYTDPAYCAPLGKKRQQAAVSRLLVPAIDGLQHFEMDGDFHLVQMHDGNTAWYDATTKRAACTCGMNPCSHQMAAVLVGECDLNGDGADAERAQLWGMLSEVMATPDADLTTADVVRANDAAYAYLNTTAPTLTFGAASLEATVGVVVAPPAHCPQCGGFLTSAGQCNQCNGQAAVAPVTPIAATPESPPPPIPTEKPKSKKTKKDTDVQKFLDGLTPPKPDTEETLPEWLQQSIPEPDPEFVLTGPAKAVLQTMKGMLGQRWKKMTADYATRGEWQTGMTGRAFGLYGPPGTGKNSSVKELAATLGLPYVEVDVNAGTDFQSLVGQVVLENGTTTAKLGNIGAVLAAGGVAVINEVVSSDPAIQTVLHQVAQDGIIRIPGPEGSEKTFKVHPNSVLVLTWNPQGGDADRPTEALTERLITLPVPLPSEAEERRMLAARLNADLGLELTPADVTEDVKFGREMRALARDGRLAMEPSFRLLRNFAAMRHITGDADLAMRQMLIAADQGPEIEEVAKEMRLYLGRHFQT